MMTEAKVTNRLAHETSPYLLQHQHNPVDWYAWSPEALDAARSQDKPIFLSIGYSACHWCHVMERESFEDIGTAAIMNEHFINIKVDREERPDLDQIYMSAVQIMTQHGGWPMSVWLTPDLHPFYGGTYFPPDRRYNMPAFREVLLAVADAWKNRRDQLVESAGAMTEQLRQLGQVERSEGALSFELLDNAASELSKYVDRTWGGIGHAPKFPHSVELRLLLRNASRTGREELRDLAAMSLERMIRGGIYDQLGGGFHRYSTDERWLVPHFEKMLYDNALIPLATLEAYQATGNEIFKRATCETLDYILREMTSPEGAFYSTQDADSEGVEGKFFVWQLDEIRSILGPERAEDFCFVYDVSKPGNWEHKNILNMPKPIEQVAKALNKSVLELEATLADSRRLLYDARAHRIHPCRDEKILTAWNGMMIETFAAAAQVLDEPFYRDAAASGAKNLLEAMRDNNGHLLRTSKDGRAHLNAYLEDYAYFANALVSVYETTFDPRWIESAIEITERMIEQFWDEAEGGFFFTANNHENLIARSKDPHDGAIPAGNSMAVTALVRLAKLTARPEIQEKADRTLALFRSVMVRSAMASAQMLLGLGFTLGPTFEFAILGDPEDETTKAALRAIHRRHLPNKVLALRRPSDSLNVDQLIPVLAGKPSEPGKTAVYICQDYTCRHPIYDIATLEKELDTISANSRA